MLFRRNSKLLNKFDASNAMKFCFALFHSWEIPQLSLA